jgi:hypothetical protein
VLSSREIMKKNVITASFASFGNRSLNFHTHTSAVLLHIYKERSKNFVVVWCFF